MGQPVDHSRASFMVSGAVLAAVVGLSLLNPNSAGGTRPEPADVEAVQAATAWLSPQQVSDAWTRMKLGDAGLLITVRRAVPLRYRSAQEENGAVIVSFAGRHGGCIDLVSRPGANLVRARRC